MEQLATGYGLIEGPVWDPARGLIFSDVPNGGVYCLAPDGSVGTVIEHRRGIGGMALHAEGGLVVSGRNIAYKGPKAEGTVVLLDRNEDEGEVGFNDLTTDAAGRIYVGSLRTSPFDPEAQQNPTPGFLYMIDTDGSSRRLHGDILLTNGLGFSPDGRHLYHSDSRRNIVGVYEVHRDGTVEPRETFAHVEPGVPDGLAVAEDGSVWVAVAHGDMVLVLNPDGSLRDKLPVPQPMVTSVCFGGEDLRDLYIVTGSGESSENIGSVFRHRVPVAGLPVPPCRVAIKAS